MKKDLFSFRLACTLSLTLLCLTAFSGCTTYTSQSFWEVTKTKVELEGGNFRVRQLGAQGTASCPYLFGIGGKAGLPVTGFPLLNPALSTEAMRNFHSKTKILGKSAFLHNINVEWTTRGVPLFLITQRLTITADVVEFTDEYLDYKSRP